MIDVVNLQRKVKIETEEIRAFTRSLMLNVEETLARSFSVAFVSDSRMTQLNHLFRGKNSTTDVLSFPHEPDEFIKRADLSLSSASDREQAETCTLNEDFLGDIVISAEQAELQAKENDLLLDAEIKQLILHGVLHLCGYDHVTDDGEMNSRELQLRDKLGI